MCFICLSVKLLVSIHILSVYFAYLSHYLLSLLYSFSPILSHISLPFSFSLIYIYTSITNTNLSVYTNIHIPLSNNSYSVCRFITNSLSLSPYLNFNTLPTSHCLHTYTLSLLALVSQSVYLSIYSTHPLYFYQALSRLRYSI